MQGRTWADIGLSPDQPENWIQPVVRVASKASCPFIEAANTSQLHEAYDQLVGEGRWLAPKGLGTFPIRFPSAESPGDDGWHIDVSFGDDNPDFMEWRANVKSRGRALLMLFLFSDVGPDDAPTRIGKVRTPPLRGRCFPIATRARRSGKSLPMATLRQGIARLNCNRCGRHSLSVPSVPRPCRATPPRATAALHGTAATIATR